MNVLMNVAEAAQNGVAALGNLYYQMTHVTEVGSFGYNMANLVGFVLWVAIGVTMYFIIGSDWFLGLLGFVDEESESEEKKEAAH